MSEIPTQADPLPLGQLPQKFRLSIRRPRASKVLVEKVSVYALRKVILSALPSKPANAAASSSTGSSSSSSSSTGDSSSSSAAATATAAANRNVTEGLVLSVPSSSFSPALLSRAPSTAAADASSASSASSTATAASNPATSIPFLSYLQSSLSEHAQRDAEKEAFNLLFPETSSTGSSLSPDAAARVVVVDVRGTDAEGGRVRGAWHVPFPVFSPQRVLRRVLEKACFPDGFSSAATPLLGRVVIVLHCMYSQQRGPACARALAAYIDSIRLKLSGGSGADPASAASSSSAAASSSAKKKFENDDGDDDDDDDDDDSKSTADDAGKNAIISDDDDDDDGRIGRALRAMEDGCPTAFFDEEDEEQDGDQGSSSSGSGSGSSASCSAESKEQRRERIKQENEETLAFFKRVAPLFLGSDTSSRIQVSSSSSSSSSSTAPSSSSSPAAPAPASSSSSSSSASAPSLSVSILRGGFHAWLNAAVVASASSASVPSASSSSSSASSSAAPSSASSSSSSTSSSAAAAAAAAAAASAASERKESLPRSSGGAGAGVSDKVCACDPTFVENFTSSTWIWKEDVGEEGAATGFVHRHDHPASVWADAAAMLLQQQQQQQRK